MLAHPRAAIPAAALATTVFAEVCVALPAAIATLLVLAEAEVALLAVGFAMLAAAQHPDRVARARLAGRSHPWPFPLPQKK